MTNTLIASTKEQKPPMSAFWLIVWGSALSCSWLLPNHYMPWTAFHTDAWSALSFLIAALVVALRVDTDLAWHRSATWIGLALSIPAVQYLSGMIPFAGQAWIVSVYLLGLLLAILTGQRWEKANPGQLADGIFWAIGVASLVSVSLQLQTWLGIIETGIFDIWSMGLSGARPYANLGQPNQLATLLIWGLLSCAWAFQTRRIGSWTSICMAVFLLVGIALTQSRTAWLALGFLTASTWWWRRLWRNSLVPWATTGLFAFFWLAHPLLYKVRQALGLAVQDELFRQSSHGELRFTAWRLFLRSAIESPWLGYGWTTVGNAQLKVASEFLPLYPTFGYSHNLFLDMILWLGIPLGFLISSAIVVWFLRTFTGISDAKSAILVMCLGVVGIHAMLEFPLYYAYFLLPTGVLVGILNSQDINNTTNIPRWTFVSALIVSLVLVAAVINDYFRIESNYREVQFESARIGTLPIGDPPKVLLLTQLRENINFMRYKVKEGMPKEDIENLIKVATAYPSGGRSYKVAMALALNSDPSRASDWLQRICTISSPDECALIKNVWKRDGASNPHIHAVNWPD